MACFNQKSTLDELRWKVRAAHPTVEDDMEELFENNDVSGEGFLPYGVVEALLRHYLLEKGLSDYVFEYLDHLGHLNLDYVRGYLHETNMLVANEDTLVTCEEMKLLGVLWLKLVSDSYKSKALNETNQAEYYKTKMEHEVNTPYNELRLTLDNKLDDSNYEEGDPHELLDSYVKSVREEVQRNRSAGITCYAYPAHLTPNGSCASAGAVIPHRRLRQRREKHNGFFSLLGCC